MFSFYNLVFQSKRKKKGGPIILFIFFLWRTLYKLIIYHFFVLWDKRLSLTFKGIRPRLSQSDTSIKALSLASDAKGQRSVRKLFYDVPPSATAIPAAVKPSTNGSSLLASLGSCPFFTKLLSCQYSSSKFLFS